MVKRLSIVLCLLLAALQLQGQQEPDFSQYYDQVLMFNPGYAGAGGMADVSALFRHQWSGIKGAPETMSLQAQLPVNLRRAPGGIGLVLTSDEYAFNKNLNISLAYAYHLPLFTGRLGLGLSAGMYQRKMEASWEFPGAGTSGGSGQDDAVPGQTASDGTFDASFGLYYETSAFYAGLSALHLFEPDFVYTQTDEPLQRQYCVTAGYRLPLSNPVWEFIPSVFWRTDGNISFFSGNCRFEYNKKFWCGVSYRQQDAVTGVVGLELSNGIRIGYAYDFPVSELGRLSDGTHEFSVHYRFNIGRERNVYKYRSIRYL